MIAGMSLVELMIAVAVLGFGLVAILNAIPPIYKAAARAQMMTVSSLLAADVQAQVKASAFPPSTTTFVAFDPPFQELLWKQEVTSSGALVGGSSSASTYLRKVKVFVSYPNGGTNREVYFHTYALDWDDL